MRKKYPKISIITPVYNRGVLIKETIDSILDQSYPNLEYIVVNDGSTDDSLKVIRKYGNKLKVINQENQGETTAVNRGLKMATGEIIGIINSDDLLLPHALKEITSYMLKNPSVLAVYPDWKAIDEKGDTLKIVNVEDYNFLKMIKEHYCMPGPGTFFRRKALMLANGRNEQFQYIADFAFWLKLGIHGTLSHLPKVLAAFRMHSKSQGIYAKGNDMAKEHKLLVDWIYHDYDLPQEANRFKKAAYASAYFHAAKESKGFYQKCKYFIESFLTNPITFAQKLKYEIVKIKSQNKVWNVQ